MTLYIYIYTKVRTENNFSGKCVQRRSFTDTDCGIEIRSLESIEQSRMIEHDHFVFRIEATLKACLFHLRQYFFDHGTLGTVITS